MSDVMHRLCGERSGTAGPRAARKTYLIAFVDERHPRRWPDPFAAGGALHPSARTGPWPVLPVFTVSGSLTPYRNPG